jgi:hypothetical protein
MDDQMASIRGGGLGGVSIPPRPIVPSMESLEKAASAAIFFGELFQ